MTISPNVLPADTNPTPITVTQITDKRILMVLRAFWIVLAPVLFFLALQALLLYLKPLPADQSYDLDATPAWMVQLAQWGLLQGFNAITGVIILSFSLASLSLSWVLLWRGKNERVQIIFAFVFLALAFSYSVDASIFGLQRIGIIVGNFAIFSIFFVFPDGRFTPGWMRYVFVVVQLWIAASLINSETLSDASLPGTIGGFFFGAGSMIYRYRHANIVQRQQLKWLLVAVVLFALLNVIYPAAFLITDNTLQLIARAALNLIGPAATLLFPLSIGLAVLRYRLWDIDLVINRSLVYGAVTLVLVAVFAGVIGLVSALTQGQGQTVGVVVAAGAAVLLFNPTRKGVQNFVDRRIYRLNFDLNQLAAAQKMPEIKNPGALTGKTIGGYQMLGVLGKGGMGEVYQGHANGQSVALKILPEDLAQQSEFVSRFEREANTMRALSHPNIVKLLAAGEQDGVRYLALEYIDGTDLAQHLKHQGKLAYDEGCALLRELAAALDYAHAQGLVHRDIKPSNVMLRGDDPPQAVLMDFGIAKIKDAATRYTGSGAIGTIDYMAPEQIMAAKEVDKRADIYALGVLTYEMFTGEKPFKGGAAQVMFAHLQQPAPDPREANPIIPRPIAHAVLRALSKSPDDRFESAGEFAAALIN